MSQKFKNAKSQRHLQKQRVFSQGGEPNVTRPTKNLHIKVERKASRGSNNMFSNLDI
jgi:hypothetical protein